MPKGHSPLEEFHHLDMLGTAVFTGGTCVRCPHGQPGDRLWVREKFAQRGCVARSDDPLHQNLPVVYAADTSEYYSWHSPLFMPRWASRITLELVNVRVERVQDITPADAIAEGCPGGEHGDRYAAVDQYKQLWQSIYRKNPARCWESNPWAWGLEFRRIEK